MAQVERYYGLTLTPDQALSLTKMDVDALRAAFELSMTPADSGLRDGRWRGEVFRSVR